MSLSYIQRVNEIPHACPVRSTVILTVDLKRLRPVTRAPKQIRQHMCFRAMILAKGIRRTGCVEKAKHYGVQPVCPVVPRESPLDRQFVSPYALTGTVR